MTKALILFMFMTVSSMVAAQFPVYELSIKEHQFDAPLVEIPAGTKVMLRVKNLDATPEEFESYELSREKVIPGNSETIIYIGPLDPGTYGFFGDFHQDTAQGKLIAK